MSYETEFLLPRLGEGDGGGRIINWLKQPGETFVREESLLEVETDKAVIEVPAPRGGRLIETIAGVDDLVDFSDPVARVEFEGDPPDSREQPPAVAPQPTNGETESSRPRAPAAASRPEATAPARDPSRLFGRRFATPWARRLARQNEIDLSQIEGSGKNGRIVGDDVKRAAGDRDRAPGGGRDAKPTARAVGFDVAEAMIDTGDGAMFTRSWTPDENRTREGVVLVHGLFGDVDAWSSNATVLARRGIAVTAVDLPCHGRSTSEASTVPDAIQRLVSTLDALGDGPFILVGHSMGAAVAARAARRLARAPAALVLLAPAGLGTDIDQSFVDGMVNARTAEALEREMRKLTAKPMPVGREFVEPLLESIHSRRARLAALCESFAVAGVQQIDLLPDLEALAIPVRIVHGRRDGIIPYHHALSAPPRAALHLPPEAGHMPQWEASGLVNDIVASLCGS